MKLGICPIREIRDPAGSPVKMKSYRQLSSWLRLNSVQVKSINLVGKNPRRKREREDNPEGIKESQLVHL